MKISIIFSLFVGITSVLNAQDTLRVSAPDTLRFHKVVSGHDAAVESLTFSQNGAFFATGSWDRKARLYAVDTLKNYTFLREFSKHQAAITSMDISADNKYIAIGSKDFTFSVFEMATGKLRFISRDHTNAVSQLFFDPTSAFLISASSDGTARVYRVVDFEQAKPNSLALRYSAKINGAQLSPSKGKFLLACDDSKVVEINVKGAVSAAFLGHSARVGCIDVSHDNKFIASGSDDKTIRIWDYKSKQVRYVLEGHGWNITSVHFSKDDRFLISSCNNGEVKIWDLQNGKEAAHVPIFGTNAREAKFSPDMKSIAVATLQKKPPYGAILYHTPYEVVVPKKAGPAGSKNAKNPAAAGTKPATGTKPAAGVKPAAPATKTAAPATKPAAPAVKR
jgi:WD40 repeat protein